MCEVLVRVHDKVNVDDVYKDVQCLKRGDVVAVMPDSQPWSPAEQTNPDWRIFKLPNVSEAFATNFLAPEVDVDPVHPSRMLRRRGSKINVDDTVRLTGQVRLYINDDARAQPTFTLNITETQLAALRVVKTPLPDPNVIG